MKVLNEADLRQRLADPTTRTQAAIEFGDWCRALILLFGAETQTACKVGAVIAIGLDKEWSEQ